MKSIISLFVSLFLVVSARTQDEYICNYAPVCHPYTSFSYGYNNIGWNLIAWPFTTGYSHIPESSPVYDMQFQVYTPGHDQLDFGVCVLSIEGAPFNINCPGYDLSMLLPNGVGYITANPIAPITFLLTDYTPTNYLGAGGVWQTQQWLFPFSLVTSYIPDFPAELIIYSTFVGYSIDTNTWYNADTFNGVPGVGGLILRFSHT